MIIFVVERLLFFMYFVLSIFYVLYVLFHRFLTKKVMISFYKVFSVKYLREIAKTLALTCTELLVEMKHYNNNVK